MAFAHRQVCNKLVLRVAQPLGSSDSAADVPRAAAISRACGRDAGAPAPELVAAACKAGSCKSWLCDFIRQSAAAANKAEMERRMRLASEAAAGWQPVKHKGGRATANAAPAAAPAAAAVPPPSAQGDLLAANRTTCAGAVPLKPPAPPAPLKVPAPPAASPKRAAEPEAPADGNHSQAPRQGHRRHTRLSVSKQDQENKPFDVSNNSNVEKKGLNAGHDVVEKSQEKGNMGDSLQRIMSNGIRAINNRILGKENGSAVAAKVAASCSAGASATHCAAEEVGGVELWRDL